MFTIDFNPVLLSVGAFEIRWYGVIYLLGFIMLYFAFLLCSKKKIIDIDRKELDDLIFYIILGLLIGARVFYFLFYNPGSLLSDPLEIFRVWHGGMSFHGALVGVIVGLVLYSRKFNKNVWSILSISAIVAPFALFIGRIGNLLNGELVGVPFNGAWCAVFANYDNICRHPYPIYAAISHLLLFGYLLLLVYMKRENLKEFFSSRMLAIQFIIGYAALRIITDIWKVDGVFLWVKTGQWLSLIMIIAGIALFLEQKINKDGNLQ